MVILWFILGAFCGGVLATVVMAMLFVSKRADEAVIVSPDYCQAETPVQGLCTADR
jgi:hypothetical protein